MLKRSFDILFSLLGLMILMPFLLIIGGWVITDSRGCVFYRQVRVGRQGRDFNLFKFRSMRTGSDKQGLLTIGGKDLRITYSGYFLRKFKLDELPQLLNVLKGDMSLVGPRPEVRKYVNLYTPEQLRVLSVRPGLTDYASIEYSNESDLLANSDDPERYYQEVILPAKLSMNLRYIQEQGLRTDIRILFLTISKILRSR